MKCPSGMCDLRELDHIGVVILRCPLIAITGLLHLGMPVVSIEQATQKMCLTKLPVNPYRMNLHYTKGTWRQLSKLNYKKKIAGLV